MLQAIICLLVRPVEMSSALLHGLVSRHPVEFVAVGYRFGLKCLTCEREFLNEDV